MAQRYRLKDGTLVEAQPDGTYREVVTAPAMTIKPSPPGFQYQGPQAAANLQRTMQEVRQSQATAAANADKARAEALKAQIDARNAQEQYDAQHPKAQTTGLYGGDFLKTLSPSDQSMVKALSEGRLAFPQGAALRAPFWQEKLSQVAQFDPTFDATNFNARAKGRAAAISGKLGTSNNALNTAIVHLGHLADQVDGTASHGGFPLSTTANAVENWYLRGRGDSGVTNFQDTANKLADEMESAYRNGGGTEQGVGRQLRTLDINGSHEQKIGVIRNAIDLLASKQAANLSQYNFGTGGKPTWDMLDPQARATLQRLSPESLKNYFAAPSANTAPPTGPGFVPPPSGPSAGGPTNGPNDDRPDPQSAALWESAARQGTKYTDALHQWIADVRSRGLTSVTPPSPSEYNKAASYIAAHPNIEYHPFESVTRKKMDPIQSASNAFAQSPEGAFTGHFGNALAFGLPSLAVGQDKASYIDAVTRSQNPKSSALGDVLGTVGGMVTAGKGVGAGVDALKANPLMARYFRGIGVLPLEGLTGEAAALGNTQAAARTALTGDTIYSGITGAAENPDKPVTGAVEGIGANLAGNAAGRYVLGPAFASLGNTKAGQAIVNSVLKRGTFAPPAPLGAGEQSILGQSGGAIDSIRGNLTDAQNLGLPYGLADANTKLRLLLGSAARKSPNVREQAESILLPRQAGQGERAIGQIDQNLAPVADVPTVQKGILKNAQTQSGPLYDAAKSQPAPELTANPAFKEVLDRPAAQVAVRKGYETALNKGEDVGTLTYATDPNGQTVQYGNPSWNVIHYARQALDANGETAVRRALDEHLSSLNPGFKAADAEYSGILKGSDALQAGADATGIKVTPEAARTAMGAFPNHGPQFQQGYASNLADTIERQRLSGNPYDLVNGSLGQQSKLATVFPEGAPNFSRAQSLEGDMSKTAYEALGGSPTAARAQSDALFSNPALDAGSEAAQIALTGVPSVRTFAKLGLKLADMRALGISGAQKKADAIGPILLNTDPSAALAHLDLLQKLAAARKAYTTQAGTLGSAIAAPITYGLTQQ